MPEPSTEFEQTINTTEESKSCVTKIQRNKIHRVASESRIFQFFESSVCVKNVKNRARAFAYSDALIVIATIKNHSS